MGLTTERRTEADEGYQRLYQAILRGEFQPNERLIEMDLAQRYSVGRAAIRTALARLEQDGLVEREPNRGARVRALSEEEAVETLEARAVLEGLAARYAARNATDADIADLPLACGSVVRSVYCWQVLWRMPQNLPTKRVTTALPKAESPHHVSRVINKITGERPMPQPADALPGGVIVHRNLAYVSGGHPRQVLDLYLPPTSGPSPLIVWIHGGAFRMGSKEDRIPLEMLEQGYAIASLNYRLSQHARFPAQIEDCKAAVRWLRAHADTYGFDPSRFASWGESAGGHLAAMLGTAGHERSFEVGDHLEHSSHVQAVLDFFGPTDFLQMDAHRPPEGMVHDTADSPESQLVGGPIQEHPAEVARANPVTYVTSEAPPFLIVHGDRDPLVPYHQSTLLATALEAARVPVTFYTVAGGGHGRFDDPQIPILIREFLAAHLRRGR